MTSAEPRESVPGPVLRRDRVKALLGHAVEAPFAPGRPVPLRARVECPWDLWWVCVRAGMPPADLGLVVTGPGGESCEGCWRRVLDLVSAVPPGHPDTGTGACGCLREWAVDMRRPGPEVAWPALGTQVALVKPGTATRVVRRLLEDDYEVLGTSGRRLVTADVRRLYPDAYGAAYVAAQDAYLTSARLDVLVLRAGPDPPDPRQVKARIRRRLGGRDVLRNHLHMPDSPGDTLCDLTHLAGQRLPAGLYGGDERDRAGLRLDYYRAVLAAGQRGTGRVRPGRV